MDIDDTEAGARFQEEGLEVLDEAEALELAGTAPIGRVVYSRFALPAVHLVNFALDGQDVVFRTRKGAKFGAAVADTVVAFEIDRIDEATRCGWTVTLTGRSRLITDPHEIERLAALNIEPWAPGPRDHYIRVITRMITGRRIRPQVSG